MSRGRMAAWAAIFLLTAAGFWYVWRPGGAVEGPSLPAGSDDRAALMNERGVSLLEEGDLDGSIAAFEEARSIDTYSDVIGRNLSLALGRKAANSQRTGSAEAQGLIDRSLAAWPENPEALDLAAAVLFRAGRYRQSWEMATRLAAFYPGRPGIHAFVARLEELLAEEEGLATEDGDRFRIRYSGARRLEFEGELIAAFQGEADALMASLGIFPTDPIEILLLTDDLGDRAVPLDPDVTGLYDGRIRLYLGGDVPPRERLLRIVRHELVHAILHRAGETAPVWYQEGVAQILGENPPVEVVKEARSAAARTAAEGRSMDLEALSSPFLPMPREERALAYAVSLAFVEHLVERHGRNVFPVVAAEMSRGASFEEALRTATGADLSALREEFDRSLDKAER